MSQSSSPTSKKLDFVYSFQPIYYFSRIFGFIPYSIIFHSNGAIQTARIKVTDVLWSMLFVSLNLLFAIQFILFFGREGFLDESITLTYDTKSIVFLRKLCNCIGIAYNLLNRFKFIEILKNINTFDKKVSQSMFVLMKLLNWKQIPHIDGHRWNPL